MENHLLEIGCDKKYVDLVRETLLLWTGDRRSFGIPVGSDASRILAEAALLTVDKKLVEADIEFIRYVDDYRIFAATKPKALKAIEILTTLLADEGLQLNSRKTKIIKIDDHEEFFVPANEIVGGEHEILDLAEKKLEHKRLQISGRSVISRYYREPGKDALRKIRAKSKDELLKTFEEAADSDVEDQIKLLIKYFIYSNDQDVSILNSVLKRKLTSIIYISDALVKETEHFSNEKCAEITREIFGNWDWKNCSYPLQLPALRISSSASFSFPELVNGIVDGQRQMDNTIFFREAIFLGFNNIDTARIRHLAMNVFPDAPDYLKRAIFISVSDHTTMQKDEKRPLLRNMENTCEDWFIKRMYRQYEQNARK